MRVNKLIVAAVLAVLVGFPAWTAREVYQMRIEFTEFRAEVRARLKMSESKGEVVASANTTYE